MRARMRPTLGRAAPPEGRPGGSVDDREPGEDRGPRTRVCLPVRPVPTGRLRASSSRCIAGQSPPRSQRATAGGVARPDARAVHHPVPAATERARPPAARNREGDHGSRQHEAAARQRRPLRAPDPPLEPEDEAIHLHRAQRHLHHRPAADARVHRQRLRVRQADGRPRRLDPVRRHQASGAGSRRRAGHPRRHALRQPALAGRHAHQLPDRATSGCSASRSSRTSSRPARWSASPRRSSWSSAARRPSSSAASAVSAT